MTDRLVAICECRDLFEAQAIRASFEARGVFVHVDGEHYRSMMGMVGSVVALRIMVRESQLDLALELAAEIIPDLERPELDGEDDQAGDEHSPHRRPPAEDLLAHRDDEPLEEEAEDEVEVDEPAQPAKKSLAVALVLFGLGLAFGLVHIYAERRNQGLALIAAAVLAVLGIFSGQSWGFPLLAMVWLVDVGHGVWLLREHNREIEARAEPKALLN